MIIAGYSHAPAAGGAFTPADMFEGSEEGGYYQASDLTTLWTDSARTTQVTSDGDAVGAWDDKSGNAEHFTQATASLRPQYKTSGGLHWVVGDGVDDAMNVPFAISASDYTICIGTDHIDDPDTAGTGQYALDSETGRFVIALKSGEGGANENVAYYDGSWHNIAARTTGQQVLTWQLIAGTGTASIRRDGSSLGTSDYTAKAFGGATRFSSRYTGVLGIDMSKYYAITVIAPEVTGTDLSDLEQWTADESGVTL